MKTQSLTVLAIGLLLGSGASHAGDQADARALLDKAMKAMNGEAKLAKLGTASVKGKITGSEGGEEIALDVDGMCQGMSQYRVDVDIQHGGRNIKGLMVLNGDKGWFKTPDKTEAAPEGVAPFIQDLFYAGRMPQLLPALADKAYKLSLLGEVKVGTRTAVGVSITHKERKDVSLFFDKENGLPLKSEIRVTEPRSAKEITAEYLYSDYKDFDGLKLCGKITFKLDDKQFTMELSVIKGIDRVDAGQFDRP